MASQELSGHSTPDLSISYALKLLVERHSKAKTMPSLAEVCAPYIELSIDCLTERPVKG